MSNNASHKPGCDYISLSKSQLICVSKMGFLMTHVFYHDVTVMSLLSALSWWRHQMETFSALLAICAGNSSVPGEFHAQRPVTRSFDVFFDLRLNKRLSKQSWGWWFETLSRPLWRHRNDIKSSDLTGRCNAYVDSKQRHHTWIHWRRDKIAAILQATSSNTFSWMNIYQFRLIFQ